MSDEIWKLRARIHFNVHYWGLLVARVQKWAIGIKLALGTGTIISFMTFMNDPDSVKLAGVISFGCAFLSTVVLPAIRWDSLEGKLENVKSRWIDARSQIDALWEDHEADRRISRKSVDAIRNTVGEIGKFSTWIPDCEKLQLKAGQMRDISLFS